MALFIEHDDFILEILQLYSSNIMPLFWKYCVCEVLLEIWIQQHHYVVIKHIPHDFTPLQDDLFNKISCLNQFYPNILNKGDIFTQKDCF